ncbi:MAG TPA: GGDEF domain-containing protein [Kofleriaceae bacterium]
MPTLFDTGDERYRKLTFDGLTSTFTRRFLESHLLRVARPTIAMAVDLDRLKRLNDIHGMPAGDHAIRHVSRTLRQHVQLPDIVVRVRGDGFLGVGAFTRERADQIRLACARTLPFNYEHDSAELALEVTVSIALFPLPHTLYEVLQLFEQRMAVAKRAGRNRVIAE